MRTKSVNIADIFKYILVLHVSPAYTSVISCYFLRNVFIFSIFYMTLGSPYQFSLDTFAILTNNSIGLSLTGSSCSMDVADSGKRIWGVFVFWRSDPLFSRQGWKRGKKERGKRGTWEKGGVKGLTSAFITSDSLLYHLQPMWIHVPVLQL